MEPQALQKPVVQGSVSLKLVFFFFFFFPPWLECHRLPIFKLSLEEVGSDRVPKVFFFPPQFPFGDQRPTRSGLSCREQNVRSITTAVWS